MFFAKKEKINIKELRTVFNVQKRALLEKGYAQTLGADVFEKETENAWKRLQEKADTVAFVKKGNIPLLLVVNPQTAKEGIERIHGHTELQVENIKRGAQDTLFYLLLDVEDGQATVAKSPKEALKKFEKEGRRAVNLTESIALLTHYPDLLKKHYLIVAGSFYPKDDETLPLLWLLDEHKNPELHYAWFHIAHGSYGTASYALTI
jgi:hypothetical protein